MNEVLLDLKFGNIIRRDFAKKRSHIFGLAVDEPSRLRDRIEPLQFAGSQAVETFEVATGLIAVVRRMLRPPADRLVDQ